MHNWTHIHIHPHSPYRPTSIPRMPPDVIREWLGWGASALADRPTPRQYRDNVKDRASKQLELYPIWVQLKLQSPDDKHPQQITQTPKATSHGPEPRIPHSCTRPHSNTQRQFRTAAGWNQKRPRKRKAHSFRCAGVPGRPERFWRGHPKAPGLWDDPIDDPGLEQFVRLGGTSVHDSDPIICSRSTELIAKNS